MSSFKRLIFLSAVLCVALALDSSEESEAGSEKGAKTTRTPKEWCEEGTFENENGDCEECKTYLDTCTLEKECCGDFLLTCRGYYCICRSGTTWNGEECVTNSTAAPPWVASNIEDWVVALAIALGIVTLLLILSATYILFRCYKTRKSQRAGAVLNVPSAAFSPSAPPRPDSNVVWTVPADQQLYPTLQTHVQPQAGSSNQPPPSYDAAVQKIY